MICSRCTLPIVELDLSKRIDGPEPRQRVCVWCLSGAVNEAGHEIKRHAIHRGEPHPDCQVCRSDKAHQVRS